MSKKRPADRPGDPSSPQPRKRRTGSSKAPARPTPGDPAPNTSPTAGPNTPPNTPPPAARPRAAGPKLVSHSKGTRRRHEPTLAESAATQAQLADLRRKIDRLDSKLVELLNERAGLVVEIGKLKRSSDLPIYAPDREKLVIDRAIRANAGPLPPRTIEAVFREMMSGSFALEKPFRVGFLGPEGSHSHDAAKKHFGSSVEFEDLHTIEGVFTEVRRGHVKYGLVPIENSTGGGIAETMDAFREHAGQLSIYAEVQYAVHHALLSNIEPKQIRRIHSKPEVFAQCRRWLATQFPRAELIAAPSSSAAVKSVVAEFNTAVSIGAEPNSAAIGNAMAGLIYGLNVLFPRIEDDPDNVTRFLLISNDQAKPTGRDKTSLMFATEDKPGALVDVLGCFHAAGVNLSYLHERPSGKGNWSYMFFVDAAGHREDDTLQTALARARAHCKELVVLGSYPRSERVL